MARLLLFENEELVAQMRPHPLSYMRRYAATLLWLLPGIVGALVAETWEAGKPVSWGLAAFAVLTAAVILFNTRVRRLPSAFGWFGVAAGVALILLDLANLLTLQVPGFTVPLALGAGLFTLRLIWWELERLARLHFLTTERLVVRAGVGSRKERALPLRQIQEVRGEHGLFGQAFDYGDIILVLSKHRGAEAKLVEDKEHLRGVGRWTESKHQITQLVEEARLSPKDRHRRMDERRVRESMRLLSKWSRRESRGRP